VHVLRIVIVANEKLCQESSPYVLCVTTLGGGAHSQHSLTPCAPRLGRVPAVDRHAELPCLGGLQHSDADHLARSCSPRSWPSTAPHRIRTPHRVVAYRALDLQRGITGRRHAKDRRAVAQMMLAGRAHGGTGQHRGLTVGSYASRPVG
jgi:hypothetical protein